MPSKSSSKVLNSGTKATNAPQNDLLVGVESERRGKFTQKRHLNDILDKVRDLAASCALYEETWTEDQENKTLIRLIGKVLSVIPAEKTDKEPEPVRNEERSVQVVRRNLKREEESVQLSLSDDETLCEPRPNTHKSEDGDNDLEYIPLCDELNRDSRPEPRYPRTLDHFLDDTFFNIVEDGVFISCVPSDTGLGTHTRWHYPTSSTGTGQHTELPNPPAHLRPNPCVSEIFDPFVRYQINPSWKRSRNNVHEAESSQPSRKKRRTSGVSSFPGTSSRNSSRRKGQ